MYGKGYAAEIKYNFSQFNYNKYKLFNQKYPGYEIKCYAYEADNPESEILRL